MKEYKQSKSASESDDSANISTCQLPLKNQSYLVTCHKILGTPWEWGPRVPMTIVIWGPRHVFGDPYLH